MYPPSARLKTGFDTPASLDTALCAYSGRTVCAAARIEYSDDEACLLGHIAGIRDVFGFHADNVPELRAALEEAVDDYLAACAKTGRTPQKPASGRLMLRVPPEVHSCRTGGGTS